MDPILPGEFYCATCSVLNRIEPRIELTGVFELICDGNTAIRGALISQEIPERLNLITRDIRLCIQGG